MRCQRCLTDTTVHRHSVDGSVGYVCDDCREVWAALVDTRSTH